MPKRRRAHPGALCTPRPLRRAIVQHRLRSVVVTYRGPAQNAPCLEALRACSLLCRRMSGQASGLMPELLAYAVAVADAVRGDVPVNRARSCSWMGF